MLAMDTTQRNATLTTLRRYINKNIWRTVFLCFLLLFVLFCKKIETIRRLYQDDDDDDDAMY